MNYWSWWQGGLGLAAVVLLHWFVLGRQMAVSGRFTAIVNRIRFGVPLTSAAPPPSDEDMIAAMRAATAEAFGEEALQSSGESEAVEEDAPIPVEAAEKPLAAVLPSQSFSTHIVFLVSLLGGGVLSALLSNGGLVVTSNGLRGDSFAAIFGDSMSGGTLVLVLGGMLVGFGTRMSSGCTSGHGLCGVSRATPAGLLATACFFGAGIVLSLLLGALA